MADIDQDVIDKITDNLWQTLHSSPLIEDKNEQRKSILELIFLRCLSDTFIEHREKLLAAFHDPESELYIDPCLFDISEIGAYKEKLRNELDQAWYYVSAGVYWIPYEARWKTLYDLIEAPAGYIPPGTPKHKTSTTGAHTVGWVIDNALRAIEEHNPSLKGCFMQGHYTSTIGPVNLMKLMDAVSDAGFVIKSKANHSNNFYSLHAFSRIYKNLLRLFSEKEAQGASPCHPQEPCIWQAQLAAMRFTLLNLPL